MQGFLDTKMKSWVRNIITRVIAIAPSLIASVVSGPTGAGKLIILSSMLLSFELPFSIIPLLKFSNSIKKIGPLKESIYTVVLAWTISLTIIIMNAYFIVWAYMDWLIHNHLSKYANAIISIVFFAVMGAYITAIIGGSRGAAAPPSPVGQNSREQLFRAQCSPVQNSPLNPILIFSFEYSVIRL